MAATYNLLATGVTWAASKNMLAWVNHTGSGVVIDTYRIWLFNIQTSAVVGNLSYIELWQCNSVASFTAGTAVTFNRYDSNSAAVPSQVIANTATTTTLTRNTLIKRFIRLNEEVDVSDTTIQAVMAGYPPLNCLHDSGYGDTNVLPLKLHPGEGFVLYTPAAGITAVGTTDIGVEMTIY